LFFSSRPATKPQIKRGITIASIKTINHINYSISSNAFPVFSLMFGFSMLPIVTYRGAAGKGCHSAWTLLQNLCFRRYGSHCFQAFTLDTLTRN
jgi:hypothetical protein